MRPTANSGRITPTPISSTRPVKPGPIHISQMKPKTKVSALRSATEIEAPTMFSTMVRSVVSRASTSPVRTFRKKA